MVWRVSSILLTLQILQIYLIFNGVSIFGEFMNPVLLLIVTVALAAVYFRVMLYNGSKAIRANSGKDKWIGLILGGLAIAAMFPGYRQLFYSIPNPVDISDVLPQLKGQYDRFFSGEMPYKQMILPNSQPFPVYMPLHWLPLGISHVLSIDVRWSGMLLMVGAGGLYGYTVGNAIQVRLLKALLIALVCLPLYSFLKWGAQDLGVSLETTIAAYYMVLALGLFQRSIALTTFGIVLCLLSRYTMIFWLPLFGILFLVNKGPRQTIYLAGTCLAAVCLLYGPFLLKDPSIFMTGLKYHNDAAAFEWEYGAWSFKTGVYFAPHLNRLFQGDYDQKIFYARVVQAVVLLMLFFGCLLMYRKWRRRINFYDFSLGALYLITFCFYIFSPLTYRYYLIVPLMLSVVICARTLVHVGRYNCNTRLSSNRGDT